MLKALTPRSLNVKLGPREGPSRGLLRDYEPSDGTFEAVLNTTKLQPGAEGRGGADTATIRNFSKFTKNPAYHSLCSVHHNAGIA